MKIQDFNFEFARGHCRGFQLPRVPDHPVLDRQVGMLVPEVLQEVGETLSGVVDDGGAVHGQAIDLDERFFKKILGKDPRLFFRQLVNILLPRVEDPAAAVGVELQVHHVSVFVVPETCQRVEGVGEAVATQTDTGRI